MLQSHQNHGKHGMMKLELHVQVLLVEPAPLGLRVGFAPLPPGRLTHCYYHAALTAYLSDDGATLQ
jgi:hypothetical protein